MKIKDEAKVQRSTKADILGKAKVMGFNELEEARAKCAEKDAAKADKGKVKRGRKRKGTAKGEKPQTKWQYIVKNMLKIRLRHTHHGELLRRQ
jgi:hypothetical protein